MAHANTVGVSFGSGGSITDDTAFEAWSLGITMSGFATFASIGTVKHGAGVRFVAGRPVATKATTSRNSLVGEFEIVRGRWGASDGLCWGMFHPAHGLVRTAGTKRGAEAIAKAYTDIVSVRRGAGQ
jgi:hypothetical protein